MDHLEDDWGSSPQLAPFAVPGTEAEWVVARDFRAQTAQVLGNISIPPQDPLKDWEDYQ